MCVCEGGMHESVDSFSSVVVHYSWFGGTACEGCVVSCEGSGCSLCFLYEGLVKPDIVFFGEMLPHRFYKLYQSDLSTCDLLVVMGTSLEVGIFGRESFQL